MTALHEMVDDLKSAVTCSAWYSALSLALTLPDICGRLADPTKGSEARFVEWFNTFVKPKYTLPVGPQHVQTVFLEGADCYALRCAYLHQGEHDLGGQRARQALDRFHFTRPRPGLVVHKNTVSSSAGSATLQLQVDLFCLDICAAVEAWLHTVQGSNAVQSRIDMLAAFW